MPAVATDSAILQKAFFLFFICFGIGMLIFQLLFEAVAIVYHIRMQNRLRRLCYRGGRFVELPPMSEEEFAHLPGLEPSPCFHLFLSRVATWPRCLQAHQAALSRTLSEYARLPRRRGPRKRFGHQGG